MPKTLFPKTQNYEQIDFILSIGLNDVNGITPSLPMEKTKHKKPHLISYGIIGYNHAIAA